jgi:hypothetical protein
MLALQNMTASRSIILGYMSKWIFVSTSNVVWCSFTPKLYYGTYLYCDFGKFGALSIKILQFTNLYACIHVSRCLKYNREC